MSKETFSDRIKRMMGDAAPAELTGGCWKRRNGEPDKTYKHILRDISDNFIDGNVIKNSVIKGNISGSRKDLKYHKDAAHLNSSQVMCINFFKKFFEKEDWEKYLLNTLKNVGVPLNQSQIVGAIFEFEPCQKERTNFDFYIELDDGRHISIEVKYTETEFGGVSLDKNDPDKYARKWVETYKNMVNESPYLFGITENDFYANYQINRNIVYAKKNDIVLFLTPLENDSKKLCAGRMYIDGFINENIRNIYWTELTDVLMELIQDEPKLFDYYRKFREKYIAIL